MIITLYCVPVIFYCLSNYSYCQCCECHMLFCNVWRFCKILFDLLQTTWLRKSEVHINGSSSNGHLRLAPNMSQLQLTPTALRCLSALQEGLVFGLRSYFKSPWQLSNNIIFMLSCLFWLENTDLSWTMPWNSQCNTEDNALMSQEVWEAL